MLRIADDCVFSHTRATAHELHTTFRKEAFADLHVVGQFNNGFIVAHLDDKDLFIIDQHASNEIYNFETLQRTTVIRTQRLLKPVTIEFAPDEEMVRVRRANAYSTHATHANAPPRTGRVIALARV